MDAVFETPPEHAATHFAELPDATPGGEQAPSMGPLPPLAIDGPLPSRALQHFERAVRAQRAGNWARYGEELAQVEALLRHMQPAPAPAAPAATAPEVTPNAPHAAEPAAPVSPTP